jgi:hypothetical protein
MKKLILTLGILITLSGCGYDSYDECIVREHQKCGPDNPRCSSKVDNYCDSEFPKESSEITTIMPAPKEGWTPKKVGVTIEKKDWKITTHSEKSYSKELVVTNKSDIDFEYLVAYSSPYECSDLDKPYNLSDFKTFYIKANVKKKTTDIVYVEKSKFLNGCTLFAPFGYVSDK